MLYAVGFRSRLTLRCLQFGLIAVGFERYGNDEALERDAIKHLYEVYVKINADAANDESVNDAARAYFKRMEDGTSCRPH